MISKLTSRGSYKNEYSKESKDSHTWKCVFTSRTMNVAHQKRLKELAKFLSQKTIERFQHQHQHNIKKNFGFRYLHKTSSRKFIAKVIGNLPDYLLQIMPTVPSNA